MHLQIAKISSPQNFHAIRYLSTFKVCVHVLGLEFNSKALGLVLYKSV